jgi:hypothetical protein
MNICSVGTNTTGNNITGNSNNNNNAESTLCAAV